MSIELHSVEPSEQLKLSYACLLEDNTHANTAVLPGKLKDLSLFPPQAHLASKLSLEQYHLNLLRDWHHALQPDTHPSKKSAHSSGRLKLGLLTCLGTLYFACDGFDGMTALLGIFSLPATLLFASGIIFSILSVIIFYSFDLVEISKNLGIGWQQTPALLDVYVEQLDEMKALIHAIHATYKKQNLDYDDISICLAWLSCLEQQYHQLQTQEKILQKQLNGKSLKIAQVGVTLLAGLIHFSSGFFAGQTVAMTLFSTMSLTASASAWPVVGFVLLIGIAAFSLYWYVEKPGIEKFVSRWVGIDNDKLEKLQKPERITRKLNEVYTLKQALGQHALTMKPQILSDEDKPQVSQCPMANT